ncbi:Tetratricopeptide repeat protein [Marinomonas spartinae]|uniref:Tetratricopeptide repeat protein n=1 Tax=Marinomonas spartinae TaxID=1792290 RepID=A0A1A8TRU7_9GAMM|nr:hypothetical protein [Marinomonas spartinae]SBS29692.1 Tetratricopeptide repeat protein [Marinomonas spartinae]SBS36882.1 Tetratricopeptide repeat protein [Marinomonas spartinae]
MKSLFVALITLGFLSSAWAQDNNPLLDIQHQWSHINYQMTDNDKKVEALKTLATKMKAMVKADPNNADDYIWLGIIQASTAQAKGGLGALSFAKEAKKNLEHAIKIDPNASEGSAYTSLGVLYHKVPGWPIGFGSDSKAKELLQKSIAINPKGLDNNFFYGEFLYDNGDYKEAKKYLEIAQQAAPRENRPVADAGRRKDLNTLLEKVNKKLQ